MTKSIQVLLGIAALVAAAVLFMATGRPPAYATTPELRDWATVRIKLTRTACYGYCPAYTVEIAGDGSVTYEGERFVAVEGVQRTTIPVQRVRELVAKFREANFFWLHDRYEAKITDNPMFIVSLTYDGHTKTVRDYVGREVGMPAVVTELEDAIDEAAGSYQWVGPRPR